MPCFQCDLLRRGTGDKTCVLLSSNTRANDLIGLVRRGRGRRTAPRRPSLSITGGVPSFRTVPAFGEARAPPPMPRLQARDRSRISTTALTTASSAAPPPARIAQPTSSARSHAARDPFWIARQEVPRRRERSVHATEATAAEICESNACGPVRCNAVQRAGIRRRCAHRAVASIRGEKWGGGGGGKKTPCVRVEC